jgi:hypothetical protein
VTVPTSIQPSQRGRATLILADISGYTRFLSNVQDAHGLEMEQGETPPAYPLMTTLLDSIVRSLVPPFVLAKLEGDAVFAYADDGTLDLRGEQLEACLAACYRTFRGHLRRTEEQLTCSCDICTSLGGLDLKFVLHHGGYVAQSIAGHSELLGHDVTIAHRMLKNSVTTVTGWRAYALISDAAAEYLELQRRSMRRMTLEYEHAEPLEAFALPMGQEQPLVAPETAAAT